MALNPLGVDLSQSEEICIICHDLLNTAPTYTLPECKHQYHTHCIVTWFRHKSSADYSNPYGFSTEIDGKCPHCGNTGVNNMTLQNGSRYKHGGLMTRRDNVQYNINRDFGRRKDAPAVLTKEIDKLKTKENEFEEFKKEIKEFRKEIKENPVNYNETQQKLYSYNRKKWTMARGIARIKKRIASYPIVPLIIPKPVDIN